MSRPGSVHATVAALVVAFVVCTADRPAAQNPAPASQDPTTAKFQSLLSIGQKAFVQAKWDDATAGFQALVDFAREQHDELWEARGVLGLGRIAARKTQYAAAKTALLQALPVFERRDASFETGMVEETLGGLAEVMGEGKAAAAGALSTRGLTRMRRPATGTARSTASTTSCAWTTTPIRTTSPSWRRHDRRPPRPATASSKAPSCTCGATCCSAAATTTRDLQAR